MNMQERTITGTDWKRSLSAQRIRLPLARKALRARIIAIGANPDKFSVSNLKTK